MWRQSLEFATAKRRIAHPLMQMRTADITLHDAHRFLAPYLSGEFYTSHLRNVRVLIPALFPRRTCALVGFRRDNCVESRYLRYKTYLNSSVALRAPD